MTSDLIFSMETNCRVLPVKVIDDEVELAATSVQLLQCHVGHQQATQQEEGVNGGQSVHHGPEGEAQSASLHAQHLVHVGDAHVAAHHEEVVAQQDPGHADEPHPVEHVQVVRTAGLLRGHNGDEVGIEGEGKA
jgi:hypothetical protein